MLLSDLIADLRLDLSDPGASLFEDQTLERCVRIGQVEPQVGDQVTQQHLADPPDGS